MSVATQAAWHMTDMRVLCTALVTDPHAQASLHRRLRWYGFLGFVAGLKEHLDFLVALEPAFRRVAELYPSLGPASELMLQARELRAALQSAEVAGRLSTLSAALALHDEAKFPLPLRVPSEACDAQRLLLAASYLLVRVWHGHAASRPACHRVLWTFAVPQDLSAVFTGLAQSGRGEANLTVEACCRHAAIQCQAAARSGIATRTGMPWPDTMAEFEALLDLLVRTDASDPFHPTLRASAAPSNTRTEATPSLRAQPTDLAADKLKRGWGNRSSHVLSDRELLPEWTFALSPKEETALAAFFTTAPAPAAYAIGSRQEVLRVVGGFLGLVSCMTASSLGESADLLVLAAQDEQAAGFIRPTQGRCFVVTPVEGRRGRRVRWWPTQPLGAELALEVENFDFGLSAFHLNCTLEELSPIPVLEIRLDLLDCLGEQLGRSRHTVDLCVKHALARHVFANTANRGIVSHLCTGPSRRGGQGEPVEPGLKKAVEDEEGDPDAGPGEEEDDTRQEDNPAETSQGEVRVEALSNYIHPGSAAVRDAYRNAVRRIRFPGAPKTTPSRPRNATAGTMWFAPADLSRLMAWLATQAQKRSGKSLAQHHNDFVVYVAALLVVQTGQRRAEHLFPFSHDWDLEHLIAFLADKIKEGSEARFVPLTPEAVSQIKAYLAHVSWFFAELDRSDRGLADAARQATGLAKASKRRDDIQHTGPLFLIRHGRPCPVSAAAVGWALAKAAQALGAAWFPPKQVVPMLRRNFATWLADDGVSGARIEVLLGHVRQMHPFGPSSAWVLAPTEN